MLEKDEKKVVNKLKDGMTYEEFENELDLSYHKAKGYLDSLREKGVDIGEKRLENGKKMFIIQSPRKQFSMKSRPEYHFGVVSDTHLGSMAEQKSRLYDAYNEMVKKDREFVLHGGDISDGCNIYRGHREHKKPKAIGWQRLLNYVAEEYPETDEFKTLFIDGNHDGKLFQKTGIHFGEQLANLRDDLKYIGDSYANIDLGNFDIDIVHPSGGTPYTMGYRAQTWLRNKTDKEKADLTIFGHLHQMLDGKTEGSHILYAGAFQGQTPYINRKGIDTNAGFHMLDVYCNDEGIEHIVIHRYDYDLEKVSEVDIDEIL